ncbi:MAG: hypothetical protein KTR18_07000 [Acidiferrobacterales bacterium]|nr:hypothetical protein [Acidiferrobacterales bacterium]
MNRDLRLSILCVVIAVVGLVALVWFINEIKNVSDSFIDTSRVTTLQLRSLVEDNKSTLAGISPVEIEQLILNLDPELAPIPLLVMTNWGLMGWYGLSVLFLFCILVPGFNYYKRYNKNSNKSDGSAAD